ncbi:MAG TPA: AAA family ATPase [Solirubrobacterales bacterium]|nr:AAA family ATPase [Solirubrobacterales bacterium]
MALGDISDPSAVRRAINEFGRIGRDAFLAKYGIGSARRYVVVDNGREYDAKAILAAAHNFQFGERLEREDFGSGLRSTVPKLRELGYTVEERAASAESRVLEERLREWRVEAGYPTDRDDERRAQGRQLAERLSEANLDEVIADPERFDQLDFGHLAHNWYGGPGPQSVVHKHLNEGPEAKRRLAHALRHLLYDDGAVADRLDDVLLKENWRMPGFGESLATKALAVVYPERWLPLYQHSGARGKLRLMESPELGLTAPTGIEERTIGRRIEETNDLLRETMDPLLSGDPWGQMVFLYWLRDRQAEAPPPSGLSELAEELLIDPPAWLEEVVGLLEEKRQVVFQGPPGTGKTFVARRLGRYFEELGGRSETVQFHPSYAYEDFVEGYRPRVVGGQPGFELVEGPLKRLALDAEADPDHKYLLIIDELNRGNLAKVFGELYFLLEYRGDRIRLQYGETGTDGEDGGRFGLPPNLWIVATMNTADRSIALMDAALRRRFYFVDFYPDQVPIDGLLERWLQRHERAELKWVAAALREANRRLEDRDAAIGPSHFMLADPAALNEERVERIWRHAVLPYLQERLIGEPERLQEFELASLRAAGGG